MATDQSSLPGSIDPLSSIFHPRPFFLPRRDLVDEAAILQRLQITVVEYALNIDLGQRRLGPAWRRWWRAPSKSRWLIHNQRLISRSPSWCRAETTLHFIAQKRRRSQSRRAILFTGSVADLHGNGHLTLTRVGRYGQRNVMRWRK